MSLLSDLVSSLLDMPAPLADAASVDPLSAVLLGLGGLVLGGSILLMGGLVAGMALNLLTPGGGGQEYPRAR